MVCKVKSSFADSLELAYASAFLPIVSIRVTMDEEPVPHMPLISCLLQEMDRSCGVEVGVGLSGRHV